MVDDSRARKLANDLKRCAYYETCATYGLNVERVFQDACQKLTTSKSSRPTTPNHYRGNNAYTTTPQGYVMASPSANTGNGYPVMAAPPSPGFQHSPHHASIPSSYHKVTIASFFHKNFFSQFAFKKCCSSCIKVLIQTKNDFNNWQITTENLLLRTKHHFYLESEL